MLGEWRSDQVRIGTANSDWALALVKLSVRLIGCDLRFAAIGVRLFCRDVRRDRGLSHAGMELCRRISAPCGRVWDSSRRVPPVNIAVTARGLGCRSSRAWCICMGRRRDPKPDRRGDGRDRLPVEGGSGASTGDLIKFVPGALQ